MYRQFLNLIMALLCTVYTGIVGAVPIDLKSVTIRESHSSIQVDVVLDEGGFLLCWCGLL